MGHPTRILSQKNLRFAWKFSRDSKGRGGAPGIDWLSPRKFGDEISSRIKRTNEKISKGNYSFRPLRPLLIEKSQSKLRLICVPTVEDRLVQRAIGMYLEEGDKLKIRNAVSYGFIRRKTLKEALTDGIRLRHQYPWVLKTDIISFFDKIDRQAVLQKFDARLPGSNLRPLIKAAIACEIMPGDTKVDAWLKNQEINKGIGLRQGMPLSPMLSNLFLEKFDKSIESSGIRMIRYADDIAFFLRARLKQMTQKTLLPTCFSRSNRRYHPSNLRIAKLKLQTLKNQWSSWACPAT